MKKTYFLLVMQALVCILLFISCKKDKSCEGCTQNNKPPIAVAGPDQSIVLPTDSVSLDGSASSDPDGIISSFQWTKISGPASFANITASVAGTSIKQLVMGVYQFELKVTDNDGHSAKDSVQITVNDPAQPNRPPIANAGPDKTITLLVNSVTLNGSGSTDPDNNITNYAWTKIAGPSSFNINNANAVQTEVNNLLEGVYQFELKITDAGGLFSKDTMKVTKAFIPFPTCIINNLPVRQATLTPIGTLTVPRMPTAGTAGNKVVFAGGWSRMSCESGGLYPGSPSSAVDIYDLSTHSWTNAQLSMPRGGIRTVSCGNKIFFAGGENGLSTVYDNVDIYDVTTNTWSVAHLSEARAYVTTAVVGNKVLFAGGNFYTGNSSLSYPSGVSNKVDIYDLSTNQWSAVTFSNLATGLYTATTLNNKVYFAGGNSNGIIEIYDNNTNAWLTSNLQVQWTPLFFAGNPVASFTVGENIYWTGNIDEGVFFVNGQYDNIYTGRVEIRNAVNANNTIECAPLNFSQHAVFRNNEVAFFASYHNQFRSGWTLKNEFNIYNTATNSWSIGHTDFSFFTVQFDAGIVSANNAIYVGGGSVPASSGCLGVTDKVYILNW